MVRFPPKQAPRARVREPDAAWENAVLKAEPPHRRDKAASVKDGGDQGRAPDVVKAKAEAPDRVAVGSLNNLPNQLINNYRREVILCQDLIKQDLGEQDS